MVVEQFPEFSEWFLPGLLLFLGVMVAGGVLGTFFGYLVAAFRHGPFEAFYVVAQVIAEAVPDFLRTSPRRVFAMARLAVKEALRRRVVLVTFAIFALTVLFGGWFMQGNSRNPAQIYINFVLWGTQMLVLLMGLLLSAFSLPDDIKNKTIYTIVTKPVRSTEIVIGRIVGFGFIGTVLLVCMGLISYFFVWRSLDHTHSIVGDSQTITAFKDVDTEADLSLQFGTSVSENALMDAVTTEDNGHVHRLEVVEIVKGDTEPVLERPDIIKSYRREDGAMVYHMVRCLQAAGHTHLVTVTGEGDDAVISLGPPVGFFRARVPIYPANLQFYATDGSPSRGTDVGKEYGRRGFVDGGNARNRSTLSRCELTFEGIYPSQFSDQYPFIPLEMSLGVYRTYKGDIEKRVRAGVQFESIPDKEDVDNKFISGVMEFVTNEFSVETLKIPRKLVGRFVAPDGSLIEEGEFDIFEKITQQNGKLKCSITCLDYNQYIGVAWSDVYFRAQDSNYTWNFVKAYLGIWCQMMVIVALGVALSTFLGSPLVMLGTVVVMIVGFNSDFIRGLARLDAEGNLLNEQGGGPIESFVRVVTQQNVMTPLETGVFNTLIEKADFLLIYLLTSLTYLAPNFSTFNFADYVVHGFSIGTQQLLIALIVTCAFLFGLTLLGYFSLKTREIAK